jgi:hypothetical protein
MKRPDYDLTIAKGDLEPRMAAVVDMLREFVTYGLCRQANTAERKSLAEHYRRMANQALEDFPDLKLNHCTCKTIITD